MFGENEQHQSVLFENAQGELRDARSMSSAESTTNSFFDCFPVIIHDRQENHVMVTVSVRPLK